MEMPYDFSAIAALPAVRGRHCPGRRARAQLEGLTDRNMTGEDQGSGDGDNRQTIAVYWHGGTDLADVRGSG